ncbi:hypothetical protein [Streptomyces sp. AC602_WCS936]|uniref:hypothetical protein n=1 Tax=Streptomyces sp. AC602_WCS936 TaxID=2823685 RepID=UPI001C25F5E0|nr:hypothetical protein [Streptomyces sp. AC602_WCS936]
MPDSAAGTVKTIAARVVRTLELPGEELQRDVAGAQLLGERGEVDAAPRRLAGHRPLRPRRPEIPDACAYAFLLQVKPSRDAMG